MPPPKADADQLDSLQVPDSYHCTVSSAWKGHILRDLLEAWVPHNMLGEPIELVGLELGLQLVAMVLTEFVVAAVFGALTTPLRWPTAPGTRPTEQAPRADRRETDGTPPSKLS